MLLLCLPVAAATRGVPATTTSPFDRAQVITTAATPAVVACPAGCSCMDRAAAVAAWGDGMFTQCSETPCAYDKEATGATVTKYCFRQTAAPTTVTYAQVVAPPVTTTTTPAQLIVNPAIGNDMDYDGTSDFSDNCPDDWNEDQADDDKDGRGNACDNCWKVANYEQDDKDNDCKEYQKWAVFWNPNEILYKKRDNQDENGFYPICGQQKIPCKDIPKDIWDKPQYLSDPRCGDACDLPGVDTDCRPACEPGAYCSYGHCYCRPGFKDCNLDGHCETLLDDWQNCGSCGHKCIPDSTCMSGTCTCDPGWVMNAGNTTCIDQTCGSGCAAGQNCYQGQCMDPYIKLLFVPLNWNGDQQSFDNIVDLQVKTFANSTLLQDCPYRIGVTKLDVKTQNFNQFTCSLLLMKMHVVGLGIKLSDYDVVVGVAQESPCYPVMGESDKANSVWVVHETDVSGATAHELGHIYGLSDEYCSNAAGSTDCRCNDGDQKSDTCQSSGNDGALTGDKNWLDPNLGCSPFTGSCCHDCDKVSYGICCHGNRGEISSSCVMSWMGASWDPQSFCQHCRDHLATIPQLQCHSPPLPINKTIVDMSAEIHPDDTVTSDRVILTDGRPTTEAGTWGAYRLAVMDSQGTVVTTHRFNVYFDYDGPRKKDVDYSSVKYTSVPFSYRFPYISTMKSVALYNGDRLIYTKELNFCNRNGACDSTETFESCPGDCPLTRPDGMCLARKDTACDPDCAGGIDPDCGVAPSLPLLPVAGAILVILVIAGGWFILKKGRPGT